ncbi:MAG: hypothetical protein L3J98_06245 [Gammaproteobacteria bacterium]|nr:hypothetical protein [Gammaproteobacteria bacterium]MCF6259745.1 hypothetical protein [Gammaproteobacteria bacterium]
MKKKLIFVGLFVFFVGLTYAIFKESGWQINTQERVKIYEKDYPSLYSIERALDILEEVEYAAIVYTTKAIRHNDSWFFRYIITPLHWQASASADVLYTVMGEEYETIEYGATSKNISNYAVFVALCVSDDMALYAPDNGYIFPATEELIIYFKNRKINSSATKNNGTCQ